MNEFYRRRLLLNGNTLGEFRKKNADMVMLSTWENDIQTRTCYIYDYFHDDEHDVYSGLSPDKSVSKFAVRAKFIITAYPSLSKDQVEYHLQFKPGFTDPLDYFQKEYTDKYFTQFPIGLYVDIPNDEGIYYRWMICNKEIGNQFIKYEILPCNYKFQWIFDNKKYEMWGIAKLRNSYNSGLWSEYRTRSIENQDTMWLPLNEYSQNLYYNQRLIVSPRIYNLEKEIYPVTWEISKVEGLHPVGIQKLVLFQDEFNRDKDFVEYDENGNICGMWADYYTSRILPEDVDAPQEESYGVITCNSTTNTIKVGGSYRVFTCSFFNVDDDSVVDKEVGEWSFTVDGESVADLITVSESSEPNSIKIKFNNNQDYVDKILVVSATDADGESYCEMKLDLVGL